MFPELRNKLHKYSVIITNRNYGQSYENKTQVVINLNNPSLFSLFFCCHVQIALPANKNKSHMFVCTYVSIDTRMFVHLCVYFRVGLHVVEYL